MSHVRLVSCLLLLLLAERVKGQEPPEAPLAGESRSAARQLDDARKMVEEQKWPEAIQQLQSVIDDHADALVAASPRQVLPARRLAHALIARLPAQALEMYRNRTDLRARRWLERGLQEREPRWLRKTVEDAFCSRPAEKALDALGDLAFERGDFDEAEVWYCSLLPSAADTIDLHYPGPEIAPSRVRAKLLLTRLFRDGPSSIKADLADFQKQDGKAEGRLAGQTGSYAAILQELMQRKPGPNLDQSWPTFGGDAMRGRNAPAPANLIDRPRQLFQEPRVRYSLALDKLLNHSIPFQGVQNPTAAARSLAFVPVIAGGQVIVADAQRVIGCDLRTGNCSEWFDAAKFNGGITPDLKLPAPPELRYTLTVADGCVFVRLGEQAIHPGAAEALQPNKPAPPKAESLLVCLGLEPGPGGDRLRWQVRPGITNDHAIFEGAPVVHAGNVYIAATRSSGNRLITAIHCYPGGEGAQLGTPPLRWRKDICEPRSLQTNEKRYRHHLLTLAGPNVVYCNHNGAIVALDSVTGRRAWAVRYPARSAPARPDEEPPLTDLSPPLCAAGRLYVAPADTDRLLCLDPTSGRLLWERTRLHVVHLLGVSRAADGPLLIFTTPVGLKAIRALDGSEEGGWTQPSEAKLPPMGRGLLVGDLVLWPTVSPKFPVFAIQQANGLVAGNPTLLSNVPAGNLAYGEQCLAVADRTQLTVFVPMALRLGEQAPQARNGPVWRETLRDLGQSQKGDEFAAPKDLGKTEPVHLPGFFALPSRRSWELQLPAQEKVLNGQRTPDLLLTARPLELARLREDGWSTLYYRKETAPEAGWRQPVPLAAGWQGRLGDRVVVGGPEGVACLTGEQGTLLWVHRNEGKTWLPGPWGGFQLDSGRLYCMQGERRLLAYSVETGRLLWDKWAPGGMLGGAVPEGRFLPGYRVMEKTLLVQTGTGRRWLLEATTGRCLLDAPADREPWPALSGDGSVPLPCLIRDGEKIVRLNANTGKEVWSWSLPAAVVRTGEPIQLQVSSAGVLVLTPTNLGLQLQRLNLDTGAALWSKPPYLPVPRLDLSSVSVDERSFYLVREQTLAALALEDGQVRWEKTVSGPKGTWKTLLGRWTRGPGKVLLVYPDQIPARRWEFCWLWGSLQWIMRDAPEARLGQGCPIHGIDPSTGQLIERLNIPAGRPQLVRDEPAPGAKRLVLHPSLRIRPVLAPSGLTVRLGEKGMVVVLGNQVLGYDGMR
jgi:outer membrane protein assembly factor BamB